LLALQGNTPEGCTDACHQKLVPPLRPDRHLHARALHVLSTWTVVHDPLLRCVVAVLPCCLMKRRHSFNLSRQTRRQRHYTNEHTDLDCWVPGFLYARLSVYRGIQSRATTTCTPSLCSILHPAPKSLDYRGSWCMRRIHLYCTLRLQPNFLSSVVFDTTTDPPPQPGSNNTGSRDNGTNLAWADFMPCSLLWISEFLKS